MKKKDIYEGVINKKINNNQEYFDSTKEIINKEKDIEISVSEKIDKLLNRNGYIFNANVIIITNQKEYKTRIAGIVNNHIITLDNEIIRIEDIIDIKILD